MEHRVEQQQEQEQAPKLCIKQCGFYGNPACLDMCSKCYRDHMAQQQKQEISATAAVPAVVADSPLPASKPSPVILDQSVPDNADVSTLEKQDTAVDKSDVVVAEKQVQANRSRCFCCNKKVGLLGFECRCGYVYCSSHRHATEHRCTFDYKSMDREKLAKANPTVAAARVEKI